METKRCGAKARKQRTTTCQRYPAVGGNGRCKLHNGLKKSIHGRWSYRAINERILERNLLSEMIEFNEELFEKFKKA